jgi:hypothetical protein
MKQILQRHHVENTSQSESSGSATLLTFILQSFLSNQQTRQIHQTSTVIRVNLLMQKEEHVFQHFTENHPQEQAKIQFFYVTFAVVRADRVTSIPADVDTKLGTVIDSEINCNTEDSVKSLPIPLTQKFFSPHFAILLTTGNVMAKAIETKPKSQHLTTLQQHQSNKQYHSSNQCLQSQFLAMEKSKILENVLLVSEHWKESGQVSL